MGSWLCEIDISYNGKVLHGARRTPPAVPAHGASNQGGAADAVLAADKEMK